MADTGNEQRGAYKLGHSEAEVRRLASQGDYLRSSTRDVLLRAGLAAGMRVLDFGSGMGDVAFAAVELVGPTGEIVGIDRSADVVEKARARAAERGIANVRFFQGDETAIGSIDGGRAFDAVIGRLVLVHQRDPVAALKSLMSHVRPGGIVAFHEYEQDAPMWSEPRLPLLEETYSWVVRTFRGAGMVSNVNRVAHVFEEAGVRSKRIMREGICEDGSNPLAHDFMAGIARTLLPIAEKLGVATAAEVQVDTLRQRLEAEAAAAKARWIGANLIAAWGRVPS